VSLKRFSSTFYTWAETAVPEMRPLFLAERGMSNARLKHPTEAIRDVEEAIRLAPDNPQFLLDMASVYEEILSPGDAIKFYERAAEVPSPELSEGEKQVIRTRIKTLRQK
jgi:tetratricopeptide (TPR) repeat protein